MKFSRTLLSISLLLVFSALVVGQEQKCILKPQEAPQIRGFKLGMTLEQARDMLTDNSSKLTMRLGGVDYYGLRQERFFSFQLKPEYSEGINQVALEFLDGKIASIEITYDGSTKFRSQEEFTERVAAGLKLSGKWKTERYNGDLLECAGFSVLADYGLGIRSKVRLYDPTAKDLVEKRRKEDEEKRRQTFKP